MCSPVTGPHCTNRRTYLKEDVRPYSLPLTQVCETSDTLVDISGVDGLKLCKVELFNRGSTFYRINLKWNILGNSIGIRETEWSGEHSKEVYEERRDGGSGKGDLERWTNTKS